MKQQRLIRTFTGLLLAAGMVLPLLSPSFVLYAQELDQDDIQVTAEENTDEVLESPAAEEEPEVFLEEEPGTAPDEAESDGSVVSVTSQDELAAALTDAGTNGILTVIQLKNDIEISGVANTTNQLNVPKGAQVTITSEDGAQYSLIEMTEFAYDSSGAKHGLIVNNGTLTLEDIILDSNGKGRGVVVNNSATLTLASGAVLKNGAENFNSGDGLGVYVVPATKKTKGGTFYMEEGAQIIDNIAEGNGGANGDSKGIGVYVGDYGTMVMTGGLISNNICTGVGNSGVFASAYSQRGGGIAAKYATVTITGGEISENATLDGGGGICVENATVMLGGTAKVINNRTSIPEMETYSNAIGGGIYVYDGTLTIEEGAEISGNIAESKSSEKFYGSGGGIFLIRGTVIMNGGTICNNIARFDGASLNSDDELTQAEYDAFLEGCGGGVFIQGGTFQMNDGLITGNYAESTRADSPAQGHGGGVYLGYTTGTGGTANPANTGAFYFYGGTVTGNTVSGLGTDIYVEDRQAATTGAIGVSTSSSTELGEVAGSPEFLVSGSPVSGEIYLPLPSECTLADTVSTGLARLSLDGPLDTEAALTVCAENAETGFVVAQPHSGYSISNADVAGISYATGDFSCALNAAGQIALVEPQEEKRIDLSDAVISAGAAVYTGTALEPELKVTFDGEELQNGKDYVAVYSNNVNAGAATVIVNGINAYTGTVSAEFTIDPRDLADDAIEAAEMPEGYYTGEAVELPVRLFYSGQELEETTDYTILYENNNETGTASAVLTGTGNYTGTKIIYFQITDSEGFLPAATEEVLAELLKKTQWSSEDPVSILLTKDIELTNVLKTGETTYAQIFGNGHVLSMEQTCLATEDEPERAMLMVEGQSQIGLHNLKMDGNLKARIVYVAADAVLSADAFVSLEKGVAANEISEVYGGQLIYNAGKTTFDGICGNTKSVNRGYGGIYNAGKLELNENSRIYDILTCFGGALFNGAGAETVMYGGTITNNSTNAKACYGTGVTNFGSFTMENGSISENNGAGAAVYNKGSFAMKDGEINSNKNTLATWGVGARTHAISGGGVFQAAGSFEMQGGEISDNTAVEGGGILVISGTFEMTGNEAKISGNHAIDKINSGNNSNGYHFGNGGGVFINGGSFIMKAGQIADNDAGCTATGTRNPTYSGYGSAIFINGGTVSISGGKISGNKGTQAYGSSNAVYYGNENGIDRVEGDSSYPGEAAITESGSPAALEIYGSPEIEDDIFVKQNNLITIPHALGDITIPVTPKLLNVGYAIAVYEEPETGEEEFLCAEDAGKFHSANYSYIVNEKKRAIVAGADLSECEIQVSDMIYTGASISPDVKILGRNGLEVTGFTKTVTSEDKINVGEKTVVITGNGTSLTGQAEMSFRILPRELTEDMIGLSGTSFTKTGEPVTPAVTVQVTRNIKADEKEYTVTYENNVDAGTATVTVTAVQDGNLSGSASKTFEIKEPETPKEVQKITAAKAVFTVEADAKAFTLGAKTSGDGTLSYSSSDESVAAVNGEGYVTVLKPGESTITIRAEETDQYKAATGTVKVVVTKAGQTITVKAAVNGKIKKTYGSKAFKLKASASGKGTLSYKSSNKKVATVSASGKVKLKGCGVATITVTAAANDIYKKAAVKVTLIAAPKKAVVKTAENTAAKTATVTWLKDTKATGYQIRYATKSNMKKAVTKTITSNKKTSLKLTGLKKGKTYYIQIREYYMVNKKTNSVLYGNWSKKKKVVIKK